MADTRSRSTNNKYESTRNLRCMICGADHAKYAFVSENPVFLTCENCVTKHISAQNGRPHIIEEVRQKPRDKSMKQAMEQTKKSANVSNMNILVQALKSKAQEYVDNKAHEMDQAVEDLRNLTDKRKGALEKQLKDISTKLDRFVESAKRTHDFDYLFNEPGFEYNMEKYINLDLEQVDFKALFKKLEVHIMKPDILITAKIPEKLPQSRGGNFLVNLKPGTKEINKINCKTNSTSSYYVEQIPFEFSVPKTNMSWVMMKETEVLFSGDQRAPRETFSFEFEHGLCYQRADMQRPRGLHGMALFKDFIYAFGGVGHKIETKEDSIFSIKSPRDDKPEPPQASCEFYDSVRDSWTMIPENMPSASDLVSCTVIRESIFITGYRLQNIIEFRPRLITFTNVNISLPYEKHKSVAQHSNLLILIMEDSVRHVNTNGDVIRELPGSRKMAKVVGDPITSGDQLYCMMSDGTVSNFSLRDRL